MAASSVTIVIDLTNYAGEVSGKLIGKPIEAQKRNEIVISGTGYVLAYILKKEKQKRSIFVKFFVYK